MSETFNGFYEVSDLGGGVFEITGAYDNSSTLFTDTADGQNDGSVAVGDPITAIAGSSFTETLTGVVPGAGIITEGSFGTILYSTNDSSLSIGQTVTINSVEPYTFCFLAGSLIATPTGERCVEALEIGDLISAADGRIVPVKWIGRQTLHKLFTPTERFAPVRVSAGALGSGLPHTDLVLTADHALILDGLAINAGALVNGTTIAYDAIESLPERVTYYHIETEDHDVILANGIPAETFMDDVQRRVFDNYQDYLDLYGEERSIREMDLPRITASRLVPPAIKARLDSQAAA